MKLDYTIKTATIQEIYRHLQQCSCNFVPTLDSRVTLCDFSKKLSELAITFEAWEDRTLIGLVSAYFNDTENHSGYINNVSVMKNYMGKGIASCLLKMCIEYAHSNNFTEISLEVWQQNDSAIHLYKNFGFCEYGKKDQFLLMKHILSSML